MKKISLGYSLMLLLAALIWGAAFVAQSVGMEHLGPFAFSGLRLFLGFLVLIPVLLIIKKKNPSAPYTPEKIRTTLTGGLLCGICLFAGTGFQQVALLYTSVGKAGFITSLYIVLVPVFGLFFKKKPGNMIWIAVILAVLGLYFLSFSGEFSFESGDILLVCCAIAFTFHIITIAHFSPRTNPVLLSCIQFFVASVLSLIVMLMFEGVPSGPDIAASWLPLAYAGIMSCGVAYTLQIVGQKKVEPAAASILLSFESVFAVLSGMIILGEMLTLREVFGCILMFAAVTIAQLPDKRKNDKKGVNNENNAE